MTKFINLTSKCVTIIDSSGEKREIYSAENKKELLGFGIFPMKTVDGIDIVKYKSKLPEQEPDVYYIVSTPYYSHMLNRNDLVGLGEKDYDESGNMFYKNFTLYEV